MKNNRGTRKGDEEREEGIEWEKHDNYIAFDISLCYINCYKYSSGEKILNFVRLVTRDLIVTTNRIKNTRLVLQWFYLNGV
jgi:hypothetical protein